MAIYTILLYVMGAAVSWFIFYYVVKAAVRNGIREANLDNEAKTLVSTRKPEKPGNPEQLKLQQRYEKGEITLEEYQNEWNRLSY